MYAHVQVRTALQTDLQYTWQLRTLDIASTSYIEEVRAFARANLVFALFGSSLGNCRFMSAGSTIVRMHPRARARAAACPLPSAVPQMPPPSYHLSTPPPTTILPPTRHPTTSALHHPEGCGACVGHSAP